MTAHPSKPSRLHEPLIPSFVADSECGALLDRIAHIGPELRRHAATDDFQRKYPTENVALGNEIGLQLLAVPRRFGGYGYWDRGTMTSWCEVLAQIARYDANLAHLYMVHAHAVGIVARHGTDAQVDLVSEAVRRGGLLATLGSEATADSFKSDRLSMILEPLGDEGFMINGSKGYASGSTDACLYLVWVAAAGETPYQERLQFALVDCDADGIAVEDNWHVLGMRATMSATVRFAATHVGADRIVSCPGAWALSDPRDFVLSYAAQHVGLAAAAIEYIKERLSVEESRQTDFALAEIGRLDAVFFGARAALGIASATADFAEPRDIVRRQANSALHLSKRAALHACQDGIEVLGAAGAMQGQPFERLLRDVRTLSLQVADERTRRELGAALIGSDETK